MFHRTASVAYRTAPAGFPGGKSSSWTRTCGTPLVEMTLAKQKPGREENPRAGLTHPRPFSYLFYVASKPTGSNDHGITGLIRRAHLCVKPSVRLDRHRKTPCRCRSHHQTRE